MELFHAANQWANRPADERFTSLADMYRVTHGYATAARERTVPWSELRVDANGAELNLTRGGTPAALTHYAFGQLCNRVGAGRATQWLREIPATLAAQNLNYGLKNKSDGNAQLLFHQNGGLVLRAATSEKYSRIWNHEVIDRLMTLSDRHGLVPAVPTFRQQAATDGAKALFASDHDMFAFLMTPDRAVADTVGANMFRGIIAINSEVGAAALKIMSFYFRDICGNFIIWGAEQLAEISLRHVGDIAKRWAMAQASVRKYLDSDTTLDRARFVELSRTIEGTKDEILDKVFGITRAKVPELSRKLLSESYDAVVPAQDGPRNSVWGLAQGITRVSQQESFADERNKIDRAAGKLLDLAAKF